ncbi:MAG: methyltransferase [Pseudomonadota bacterium]
MAHSAETPLVGQNAQPKAWSPLWLKLLKNTKFRNWSARLPIIRRLVRRDQQKVFDLMAGFAYSQVLSAAVEVDLFAQLISGPKAPQVIVGLPRDAAELLCRAAAGLDLLRELPDGRFALTRHGAIIEEIAGLKTMIAHHAVLYRDLSDPLSVLKGTAQTEMASFWPYVFGATDRPVSKREATLYSQVMTDTQSLVAQEVLTYISFSNVNALLDIGGGTGAFLDAVHRAYPDLRLGLFDLPNVVPGHDHITSHSGNFRKDRLPDGYNAISLIRVLFDHQDDTIKALLAKVHDALPLGGRLIVAEPMAGSNKAHAAGDAYYAIYTRAMGTGKTRKPSDIATLLEDAGFGSVRVHSDMAPTIARVIDAKRVV